MQESNPIAVIFTVISNLAILYGIWWLWRHLPKRIYQPAPTRRKAEGLRKLPFDTIIKARDDSRGQVDRILLTFVGTVVFCVLSLLTPDSALIVAGEKLNVPLAGPISFSGFMVLGPAVLICLRVYLQIYVEHQRRLDRVARYIPRARTPAITPDNNSLLRGFRCFAYYMLLPLAMLAFWRKAAALPNWEALFLVAAIVAIMHLTLLFRRLSWRLKFVVSLGAALLVVRLANSFDVPLKRPINLFGANLADQWLYGRDLENAFLDYANLSGANLTGARLSGAKFQRANLTRAVLRFADLTGSDFREATLSYVDLTEIWRLDKADFSKANLSEANISGAFVGDGTILRQANLTGANFTGARLEGADLSEANGLTQQQLNTACGDAKTRLPVGLSVKFCGRG